MKSIRQFDWSKISYVAKGTLVGVLAGLIISLFRVGIELTLTFVRDVYRFLNDEPIWIIGWIIAMLVTALIVALLIRDEPDIKGSGIQDIEGQLHGMLHLRWFSVLWRKFIGGVLSIGSGLALGREGPSIQLGGAIGQGVSYFLKGNESEKNVLISAGSSAGLAAAFNAPVSGIMFILEEVHHKFSGVLLLTAFSASITANFVAYQIFGVQPALDLGALVKFPLEHYLHLVLMGAFLAVAGWAYQEVLFYVPKLYQKLPIPNYLHGTIPFLLVIPVGLFFPMMLGGGTGIVTLISGARFSTLFLIGIFLFRFVFSHLSYGSGLPGGIFIPVLSLGAILGAIYGNGALHLMGVEDALIRSFVIYAMGGYLTAVTKAPLTAVMLITEMTGTITQLMPLAIVCLSAYIIADFIGVDPVYETLLNNKVNFVPKVFQGEIKEFSILIETNSHLDGMMIRHTRLPYGAKVSKVKRHSNEFVPHKDSVLLAGDELTVTTDSGFVSEVKKHLDGLNK